MPNVFGKSTPIFIAFALAFLVGCSRQSQLGPAEVRLIRPSGERCQYAVGPATLQTLESLEEMRGGIGRVVMNTDDLTSRPEILDSASGFRALDAQFTRSGNTYLPVDMEALYAASLYYAYETGYLLFAGLDTETDFIRTHPGFGARTYIVHEASLLEQAGSGQMFRITDNAEYLPHWPGEKPEALINYFFSYPTDVGENMPLGLNLGIMVHEYSHLVFHYQFEQKRMARGIPFTNTKQTQTTLAALDEGIADYFGFLATKDPAYFLCSAPEVNRDLSVPKSFSADIAAGLDDPDNFDPHDGGAVWAAINYEIGTALGNHETNARTVIRLMSSLLDCAHSGGGISLDFATVARCHAALGDSRSQSIIQSAYQSRMGALGGAR